MVEIGLNFLFLCIIKYVNLKKINFLKSFCSQYIHIQSDQLEIRQRKIQEDINVII